MKTVLLGTFTLIFLCGCANKTSTQSSIPATELFDTLLQLYIEQDQEHQGSSVYEAFRSDWLQFNNANRIDERGNCYAFGGKSEDIILIYDAHGIVQQVVPKNLNRKTKCFINVFLGQEYPAPPFAPYYGYMRMGGY